MIKRVFPAVQDAATIVRLVLVDGEDTPIALANISEAWLTLWDGEVAEDEDNILNTRDHVDILNANDVVIGDTDGSLLWAVQAEDNLIVNSQKAPGETELHLFEIEVQHTQQGSPFRGVYGLRVRVMQKGVYEVAP